MEKRIDNKKFHKIDKLGDSSFVSLLNKTIPSSKRSDSHFDFAINNILPKSKRSQVLGLSFESIFSIILIVFFIVIAIIVINAFLKTQRCAKIGIFIDGFKSDVEKSWNSQYDKHTFKGDLPGSINYVCFANLSRASFGEFRGIGKELNLFEGKKANMFFWPTGKACEMPYHYIAHLDNEKITKTRNPNCFAVKEGEAIFEIEKGLNDRFVNLK
ncbi:MAG: hypothetical protein AABW90_02610 [Nanoarchaeota archaeon]